MKGAIEQYTKASFWHRAVILYRELKKHNEFVTKDYLRYEITLIIINNNKNKIIYCINDK